jgi:hypothetical protein
MIPPKLAPAKVPMAAPFSVVVSGSEQPTTKQASSIAETILAIIFILDSRNLLAAAKAFADHGVADVISRCPPARAAGAGLGKP